MAKALFAVVLVSASFAGGAFVNGPGLQWAKALVLNRMGLDEDGGDAAAAGAEAEPGSPREAGRVSTAPNEPTEGDESVPARPIPPLVLGPPAAADRDKARSGENPRAGGKETRRAATASSASPMLPGVAPVPEGSLPPLDTPAPAPLTTPHDRERDALALAASVGAADDRSAPEPPAPAAAEKARRRERDPAVRLVSLPDNPPAVEPAPAPAAGPEPAPSPATGQGEWAEVRNELKALGVSRYGIEGEPAGRVRFHCVIPLAGRRAVGQHFEAEGDDELQAARAALKRVALWKATEGAGAR